MEVLVELFRGVLVVFANGLLTALTLALKFAFVVILLPAVGYLLMREYQEERPADPLERRALY